MGIRIFKIFSFFSILFVITSLNCYSQKIVKHNVVMRTTGSTILHDNNSVVIYGFAESPFKSFTLPSKTLYANEGDSVIINALNLSREPHTVHLHGLDVDTRNDGDPMTSFYIDHQQDTNYSFLANHAGTYIYHCHFQDVMHLQMGMYGLLIIRAANGEKKAWTGGPSFTREYAFLTSELDKYWHDTYEGGHTNYTKHPKYKPAYFLINGKSQQQLLDTSMTVTGAVGDKIYIRLANIGFYSNKYYFPKDFDATVIDSDGRPLPKPFRSDTLEVMPGERHGVMFTAKAAGSGSLVVEYVNMNTYQVEGLENIQYDINDPLGTLNEFYEDNLFTLYPNPAKESIRIAAVNGSPLKEITIVNPQGFVVEKLKLKSSDNDYTLDIKNLSPGIYCMRVHSELSVSQQIFIVLK